VKDASGNALAGIAVTFTAPSSGPSGTFPGSAFTVTVNTNGNGIATAPVFTANSTPGTYVVTATTAGVGAPTTFTLTNTTSSAASIAVPPAPPAPGTPPALPPAPPRSVTGSDYLSLTGATGLVDQFIATYIHPGTTTGSAALGGVLAGAQLLRKLQQPRTYIVFWAGSAAGGTQRDRKNLITNVFTGDWISYSGGAVLSFGMIDASTGQLTKPSVSSLVIPYTHFQYNKAAKDLIKQARQGVAPPQ
jgi:hypothetical protein